jgi:hypothetical protein
VGKTTQASITRQHSGRADHGHLLQHGQCCIILALAGALRFPKQLYLCCILQGFGMSQLQHALQDMSQQAGGLIPEVSSITLAASSSTLTPERRLQLRQQLAASISQQKDELVQQQLLQSDPLLAAL